MVARVLAAAALAAACGAAAQQPPSPPPRFAAPNLSPAGVRALAATCAPCHGTEGQPAPGSTAGALAGRPRGEVSRAFLQFRDGGRPATVMPQIARGFTDEEAQALDEYFSRRKRTDAAQ